MACGSALNDEFGLFAEAACHHRIPHASNNRFGFAGQRCLSHKTFALDDHPIDRDGFSGQHSYPVADADFPNGHPSVRWSDAPGGGEGVAQTSSFREGLFSGPGRQCLARAVDCEEYGHHLIVHGSAPTEARHQRGPEGTQGPRNEQQL